MSTTINVRRFDPTDGVAYWQAFEVACPDGMTVADALCRMQDEDVLFDVKGDEALAPAWECSCREGKCGACAMVIDGMPQLACEALLKPNATMTLEPLSKFPTVRDLVVDRSYVFDVLRDMQLWLEPKPDAEIVRSEDDGRLAFAANACLGCGCCLEVCPNFSVDGKFVGGLGVAASFGKLTVAGQEQSSQKVARKRYRKHVYGGCSKSLSCVNVCPAELPLDELMSRSNAAAWFRRV